jgi:hypothetical protein
MKKIILVFSILVCYLVTAAQPSSLLKPAHVVWKADDQNIFLPTAFRNGIAKPDTLALVLFFEKNDFSQFNQNKLPEFEFQWYRYASTKRFFVQSIKGIAKSTIRDGKYYVSIESKISDLKPGWWEVQVISYEDNGLVEFNELKKFQILIK